MNLLHWLILAGATSGIITLTIIADHLRRIANALERSATAAENAHKWAKR
jgi:hypothetical protein